jgi:hypothetical protein
MLLKWGSFSFEANSLWVSTMSERLLSPQRIPYGFRATYKIKGWLLGSGQADLKTKSLALETALKSDYQDLVFLQDDGSASATVLRNADSIDGTVVTSGPNFNGEAHSEYVSQREFDFEVMAEFHFSGTQNLVIGFTETLIKSGGGPLFICKRAVNTVPQRQQVYPATEYVVVQRGSAIGLRNYPVVPPSLFPFALKESPTITPVSPQRIGKGYQNFEISWEYVHEFPGPLIGVPNRWTTVA